MSLNKKNYWTKEGFFHDAFVCLAFYCFLTGLIPFAPEKFYQLAGEKPWIHRVLVAGITLLVAIWAGMRYWRVASTDESCHTPLIKLIKQIKVPMVTWVWSMFIFSSFLWSYASIARHQAFQSGFDMAIFTQAIWNVTNGEFLYSSIKGGICLLGDHFSPLLAVFSIPYYLWPKPECLLILQATLCASSIFPLFLIAKRKLSEQAGILTVLFAFICYLPLRNSIRFDFHPEVATLPFFFWSYYFFDSKRLRLCSLFLILALLSKESIAIITFAFGFYALCKRRVSFGIIWMGISLIYFYVVVHFWIPQLSGQPYLYLSGNYLSWGQSGIFSFLRHLFSLSTFFYLIKIFLPLGFLPFGHFAVILTLPGLIQNLASQNEMTRSIFFQYTAILTPFVFISLVETMKKISPHWRQGIWIYLLFFTLLTAGISDVYIALRCKQQQTLHKLEISTFLKKVPAEASVRTHEFFATHLANRKEVYIYENHHPREGGSHAAMRADYLVLDRFLLSASPEFLVPADYQLDFEKNGFMILKRKLHV